MAASAAKPSVAFPCVHSVADSRAYKPSAITKCTALSVISTVCESKRADLDRATSVTIPICNHIAITCVAEHSLLSHCLPVSDAFHSASACHTLRLFPASSSFSSQLSCRSYPSLHPQFWVLFLHASPRLLQVCPNVAKTSCAAFVCATIRHLVPPVCLLLSEALERLRTVRSFVKHTHTLESVTSQGRSGRTSNV